MKKLIFIFICICLITGCGKKEETYKHTTLEDYNDSNPMYTSYYDTEGKTNKYAIVQKVKGEENIVYVLYEDGDNSYIQVFGISIAKDKESSVGYYENKVYVVSTNLIEYTLDKETTSQKDLSFYLNDVKVIPASIIGVDKEYIKFKTYIFENEHHVSKEVKCSLIDYTCEEE